jgi:hypothetical protein
MKIWTTLPLLTALLLAATLPASSIAATGKTRASTFVDEDGDGFNDLAPDSDRDGIPDALDPHKGPAPGTRQQLWAAFRAMPDSVSRDSLSFRQWWTAHVDKAWQPAWRQWQDRYKLGGAGPWDCDPQAPGPRGGRFLGAPGGGGGRRGGNGGNGGRGGGGGGGGSPAQEPGGRR